MTINMRGLQGARLAMTGGKLSNATGNFHSHREHGDDPLISAAHALGLTPRRSVYAVGDMATGAIMGHGKFMGSVGAAGNMVATGLGRAASATELLDEIANSEQFFSFHLRRYGGLNAGAEAAPDEARALIAANNFDMHQRLEMGEDFGYNAGANASNVAGGMALSHLMPGGMVVGMASQLAGGMGAEAAYDAVNPDATQYNDQMQLFLMLKNYQDAGGVVDENINQALLILRSGPDATGIAEDRLGMSLKDAIGQYMEARLEAVETGNATLIAHHPLTQVVNDAHLDDIVVAQLTGNPNAMRVPDENGNIAARPTLGRLFSRYGMKNALDPHTGHYTSEHHPGAMQLGSNFAQILIGDMPYEISEVTQRYEEEKMAHARTQVTGAVATQMATPPTGLPLNKRTSGPTTSL